MPRTIASPNGIGFGPVEISSCTVAPLAIASPIAGSVCATASTATVGESIVPFCVGDLEAEVAQDRLRLGGGRALDRLRDRDLRAGPDAEVPAGGAGDRGEDDAPG